MYTICRCFYSPIYFGDSIQCLMMEGQHFTWNSNILTETSLCFLEVVSLLMLEPGLQPLFTPEFCRVIFLGDRKWTAVKIIRFQWGHCCIWSIATLHYDGFFNSIKENCRDHPQWWHYFYLSHLKNSINIRLSFRAPTGYRRRGFQWRNISRLGSSVLRRAAFPRNTECTVGNCSQTSPRACL